MRSWQTLAAPDDSASWTDVLNMWPSGRGPYETSDGWLSTVGLTATGETTSTKVIHAAAVQSLSAVRCYLFTSAKSWEYNGATLTDRTNALGGVVHSCQFGDQTIGTRGTGSSVVVSTGGNFAALGGSPPNAEICLAVTNFVLLFNLASSSDGWAACDLGDAATWTPAASNRASNGRLYGGVGGPVTAACALGSEVLAFKSGGIYRGRYTGSDQKWLFDIAERGIGCKSRYGAVNCGDRGVAFIASAPAEPVAPSTIYAPAVYVYDGVRMQLLNPLTNLWDGTASLLKSSYCLYYDPRRDLLFLTGQGATRAGGSANADSIYAFVYSFRSGQWGRIARFDTYYGTPILGTQAAIFDFFALPSPLPPLATVTQADTIAIYLPTPPTSATHATAPYLQSALIGDEFRKTNFKQLSVICRSRSDLGSGSLALTMRLYRERHGSSVASQSVTESTIRNRFDLMGGTHTDNFADFKLTATALDIEVEDLKVDSKDAGAN